MSSSGPENRRSIRFAEQVDPDSKVEETFDVETEATIEGLDVRIYRGAELDLHIKPWIKREGKKFPLIEYQGKNFIDGDADHWEFPVSESIRPEDTIGVTAENVDTEYALDYAVDVTIDRAGGLSRFGGLLDGLVSTLRGAI